MNAEDVLCVALGVHLCGPLSPAAIGLFEAVPRLDALVLVPCCLDRRTDAALKAEAKAVGVDGEDYPGANDIYEAASTFESYGVPYGVDAGARSRLSAAVPASHKAFLRDLLWVHEQQLDFAPGSLVAVHAGLLATKPLAPQMDALRRRDAAAKVIQENEIGRFEALSGRKEVERMHPLLPVKENATETWKKRRANTWYFVFKQ